MPVLPLIDLMILMGSGGLLVAFVLKGVALTTHYRPSVLGFGATEFVIFSAICMAFALTLAARTWVKLNEPRLLRERRRLDAHRAASLDFEDERAEAVAAGADRR